MNLFWSIVANTASAFLAIIVAFAIIGASLLTKSMIKTLKEKNYSPAFNAVIGLGLLAMILSTCIPLIMLVATGALKAPLGFAIGTLIAYKKKIWFVDWLNKNISKVEKTGCKLRVVK